MRPIKLTERLDKLISISICNIRSGIIGIDNPTIENSELYKDEHQKYK